jgi:hypothetical protein
VILASIMIQQLFGGPYTNPIDVENRILMIWSHHSEESWAWSF